MLFLVCLNKMNIVLFIYTTLNIKSVFRGDYNVGFLFFKKLFVWKLLIISGLIMFSTVKDLFLSYSIRIFVLQGYLKLNTGIFPTH